MPASEAVGAAGAQAPLKARIETLVRAKGELARQKAKRAMIGGGVTLVGAGFLKMSLLVAVAAIAAGIATVLDPWLAILVVFGALFVVGLLLVAIGVAMLKRGDGSGSPIEQTAGSAKESTIQSLRSELRGEAGAQTAREGQVLALALGAFAAGFVLSGGVGATVRPLLRKRRQRRARRAWLTVR